MLVLGIEGTAHTCGVGVVEGDPEPDGRSVGCRVLSNQVDMLRPPEGGIHPREAADHHVAVLPGLVERALRESGISAGELDGVAFSQGPGLGPCLRTVATAARALALMHDVPVLGVNHCVAHLEIARATTPASDPVMLYASGANTQVIAESRGRYRVFGETLDVGIGNALDKFARDQGIAFPGGPQVERLAGEGARVRAKEGMELPGLPYSVKGMDVAFSGLVTAANSLVRDGVALPVVCEALQEWAFSPLVEVTERALAHTGKESVVLGGGVGRNRRLQDMLFTMAHERGATAHWPEPGLLSDNGAMIAYNGLLLLASGHPTPMERSAVNQRYRTDEVPLLWRSGQVVGGDPGISAHGRNSDGFTDAYWTAGRAVGAEAVVTGVAFLGEPAVVKKRVAKGYRHARVELLVAARRIRQEARFLVHARQAGVRVPHLLDASRDDGVLVMEEIQGPSLKALLGSQAPQARRLEVVQEVGRMVARLHTAGLVHGDLTTSNILMAQDDPAAQPVLIDFGLASHAPDSEAQAVDLHVFQEALQATHGDHERLWAGFLKGYSQTMDQTAGEAAAKRLRDLQGRGRYRSILA